MDRAEPPPDDTFTSLAAVIVDQVLFLAMTPDELLDPDTTVNQLESITWALQRLPPLERQAVDLEVARRLATATGDEAVELEALRDSLQD